MPTINASRWGYARVAGQSSHSAARNFTGTGQAQVNPSTAVSPAFAYQATSSGRGLAYTIYRAFYYFNVTSITSLPTSATVNIEGHTGNTGTSILVPSTAFSGDGSTNLAGDEFGDVSFNTNYNTSLSSWSTTGNNSFTLTGTALNDIKANNYFICAVLQYDNDYANVDIGGRGGTINFGIDYTTTAYLDYVTSVVPGPTNLASMNGVVKANMDSLNNVSLASINEINGVT